MTGKGMYYTLKQALNKPMIPPSKYTQLREEVLSLQFLRELCANFLVDKGGANIMGRDSLFNSLKGECPWLKEPWDITHELTTKFKRAFNEKQIDPIFLQCMTQCKELTEWFSGPKHYQLLESACCDLGVEVFYQSRNVNDDRMIPTLRSHLEDFSRNLPAYHAALNHFINLKTQKGKEKPSLDKAIAMKRKISTHQFMSALYFLIDIIELEAHATVWTESHTHDLIATRAMLHMVHKSMVALVREDGPCLRKYCKLISKKDNIYTYTYKTPRTDDPDHVECIELKDYSYFQDLFHDIKAKFTTNLKTSLDACLKVSPEMDAFDAVFNVASWPANFANVDGTFFSTHAAAMCASWVQSDSKERKILPCWVRPMLEHELKELKTALCTQVEISQFLTVNDKKRRMFWPMFFEKRHKLFPALAYFWKLQQQLGRSGVAIEQFISKLHYIMGNPLRQHSADEWLEFSTMACQNGPTVAVFDPTETFEMWKLLNHQMVKIGCVVPKPEPKDRLVYGVAKRASRAMKKKERRERAKREQAIARGLLAPNLVEDQDSDDVSSEGEVLLDFFFSLLCDILITHFCRKHPTKTHLRNPSVISLASAISLAILLGALVERRELWSCEI